MADKLPEGLSDNYLAFYRARQQLENTIEAPILTPTPWAAQGPRALLLWWRKQLKDWRGWPEVEKLCLQEMQKLMRGQR